MDDVQSGQSATPEGEDPKPVFEGDWQSATGVEKGRHSERVRQWRKRQEAKAEAEAQSRMAAGSEQPVSRMGIAASPDAPDLADPRNLHVLRAIRDDAKALPSDRIRATQTLLQAERGAEAQGAQTSDLVALRSVLETLRPEERLAWLQGERLEALSG